MTKIMNERTNGGRKDRRTEQNNVKRTYQRTSNEERDKPRTGK